MSQDRYEFFFKPKIKIPVWIAFSTEDYDGTKLRSGEDLSLAKNLITEYKFDTVLINCSRPEVAKESLKILADFNKPFGAYANGFTEITAGFLEEFPTVDALKERHDLSPKEYAKFATVAPIEKYSSCTSESNLLSSSITVVDQRGVGFSPDLFTSS